MMLCWLLMCLLLVPMFGDSAESNPKLESYSHATENKDAFLSPRNPKLNAVAQKYDAKNIEENHFIRDVIRDSEGANQFKVTSIILIASQERMSSIYTDDINRSVMRFEFTSITKKVVQNIWWTRFRDDESVLYIILPSTYNEEIEAVGIIETIRDIDFFNPIMPIYNNREDLSEIYQTKKLYNVFPVIPNFGFKNITRFDLYEVCAYCQTVFNKTGVDTVPLYNRWSLKRGFIFPFTLPPSFKGTFNGARLTLGCIIYRLITWSNYDSFIMQPIMPYMDFYIDLVQPSDNMAGSVINGKPTGCLNQVYSGETDIGGCYLGAEHSRFQFTDFSYPYNFEGLIFMSGEPPKGNPWYSFIKPYPWDVWVVIFSSVPVCGFVLWLIYKYSPDKKEDISFYDATWHCVQIICWDNVKTPDPPVSVAIFLFGYMVMTLVVITGYLGTIISFLINPSYMWPPIDTFEQFAKTDMKWLAIQGNFFEKFFEADNILHPKMHFVTFDRSKSDGTMELYGLILEQPDKYLCIETRDTGIYLAKLLFQDDTGYHGYYFSRDAIGFNSRNFFWPKKAIFKKSFNYYLMKMWEGGFIENAKERIKFVQKGLIDSKVIELKRKGKPPQGDGIKLIQVSGGFLCSGVGAVLALISFFFELLLGHFRNMKRIADKVEK